MLRLSVLKGPDKGKTQVFHSSRVTIGDDNRNDFKLSDAMISRFHGVFEVVDEKAYVYRDLGSLNGSFVRSDSKSHTLHDRTRPQGVELEGRSRVALGRTLIEAELNPSQVRVSSSPSSSSVPVLQASRFNRDDTLPFGPEESGLRESVVRRSKETPEQLASRISTSTERLQVLFRLARRLNALNRIEDILDRVVEATFEIFPLANFFAIVVPTDGGEGAMRPLYSQLRDGSGTTNVMLSQSLLREVVERRESVLYVHDNLGNTDTRKSIIMAKITACLAAPLFGQSKMLGVMQVDSRGRNGMFGYDDLDLFTVLASSAAFAMERARLSANIYEMFEAFVNASVAAIDSRDPTTAGHSQRVADYTVLTAQQVNLAGGALRDVHFTPVDITELRYAALLHDFGKIGVREKVLQKAARLAPGAYNALLSRIDSVASLLEAKAYKSMLEGLRSESRIPTANDIDHTERVVAHIRDEFDAYRRLVTALQDPRPLAPMDRAAIKQMSRVTYTDLRGEECSLLTEAEANDLNIQAGTLNDIERSHIESHAALTRDYLSRIPWSDELARIPCIAGRHHEKLDGSGYPDGLNAAEILPQTRILTITDIFDALTATDRPYKRARSASQAVGILRHEADSGRLDGDLVEFFAENIVPRVKGTLLRER